MKLALWQNQGPTGQTVEALRRLAQTARAAADAGVDLILCPELYLSGYNAPDVIPQVAELRDGPSARQIAAICLREHIAIAYGYPERDQITGRLFNAAQLIAATGEALLHYRKTHLYGAMEHTLFTPGESLGAPVAIGAWRAALLICYDIEFPEPARALALQGADLLLVPTALPAGEPHVPNLLVPARAAENTLYVAYCNRSGIEAGLAYEGASLVAGPDGAIRAAAGPGETLLTADLDLSSCAAARTASPYLEARRASLYGALAGSP